MITRIHKWGNSQGLRLSKELLSQADIEVGDAVEVALRDGSIVITPARRVWADTTCATWLPASLRTIARRSSLGGRGAGRKSGRCRPMCRVREILSL